jgi:hypothetical protein
MFWGVVFVSLRPHARPWEHRWASPSHRACDPQFSTAIRAPVVIGGCYGGPVAHPFQQLRWHRGNGVLKPTKADEFKWGAPARGGMRPT